MTTLTTLATQHKLDSHQEIGELLLRVQDELKGLRTLVSQEGAKIDIKVLQSTLEKTENNIKEKTDHIINSLNSQVKTLPSADIHELTSSSFVAFENPWSLTKRNRNSTQRNNNRSPALSSNLALISPQDGGNEATESKKRSPVTQHRITEEVLEIPAKTMQQYGLSPGQQVKIARETRALFNPYNSRNRVALNENYNIQLPLIEKRESYKLQTHLITGTTVEHLSTLPLANRRNPGLAPPPVGEKESRHGLHSLIERGFVPANAQISFEQFPITSKVLRPSDGASRTGVASSSNRAAETAIIATAADSIYKLDVNHAAVSNNKGNDSAGVVAVYKQQVTGGDVCAGDDGGSNIRRGGAGGKTMAKSTLKRNNESPSQAKEAYSPANPVTVQINAENPLPPPATPLTTLQLQLYDSSKFAHRFVIQNGSARTDMQDYVAFKQSYCLRWGSIVTIIKYLEDLCDTFSVQIGLVDGLKISELSRCVDMDLAPTMEELLDTFLNKEDVEKLVRTPGQRFKRKGGANLAAIRIQCAWRRHRDRVAYLQYRKRKWAAGVIALTWLTYVKVAKAREKLRLSRIRQLENLKQRQKELVRAWPTLKNAKRVVIHIPSLGFSEAIRDKMRNLTLKENYQMARLCDIIDDNVDVIYVSSIPITEETLQYYLKLFGLRTAVISGNVTQQADYSNRYKIVIPEALNSFPTHNMALSTLLKYSPKALERIRNLIKGRDAYIVPGVMSHDDIYVAEKLNVPIMACEPEIANLYSAKSGSKRIFQAAKVAIPIGEFDIYNKDQLYECLAQLITENLSVQRWLFKLDTESDGRGIAYCNIANHLTCYNWALKEMTKFGDKWSKRWAYEPTYVKILEEIPDLLAKFAKPANTSAYATWDIFLKAFLAQGGIVEAHPASDNVTALTVSMLIEPDGSVRLLASGDHVHAESVYSCWGLTFPQTSVEPALLNDACLSIADACKQRNIFGHVDVDFVTFIDVKSDEQVVWATDLSIAYSDHVAMCSLLYYMTDGSFDSTTHSFEVSAQSASAVTAAVGPESAAKPKTKSAVVKLATAKQAQLKHSSRYAILSTKLHHSNLAVIHYSVFFQTCRALGIGYDIKEKQGTIFTLVDSLNHVNMGMLTVTDNLEIGMQQFAHNLSALHHEISSANMQGKTNFLLAAQDIKNTLVLTAEETSEEISTSGTYN